MRKRSLLLIEQASKEGATFYYKGKECKLVDDLIYDMDGEKVGSRLDMLESMIHNINSGRRYVLARKIFLNMLNGRINIQKIVDYRVDGHYELAKIIREMFLRSIKIDCDIVFENGYFWVMPLWDGGFAEGIDYSIKDYILRYRERYGIWDWDEKTMDKIKKEIEE